MEFIVVTIRTAKLCVAAANDHTCDAEKEEDLFHHNCANGQKVMKSADVSCVTGCTFILRVKRFHQTFNSAEPKKATGLSLLIKSQRKSFLQLFAFEVHTCFPWIARDKSVDAKAPCFRGDAQASRSIKNSCCEKSLSTSELLRIYPVQRRSRSGRKLQEPTSFTHVKNSTKVLSLKTLLIYARKQHTTGRILIRKDKQYAWNKLVENETQYCCPAEAQRVCA